MLLREDAANLSADALLTGGGEVGALMRSHDGAVRAI
jgi:hypothetical protein